MSRRNAPGEDFEHFIEREFTHLRRVAISLTGNPHDADDLLQDTLAKLLVHWGKVTASASPTRYAHRVLINTFLSGKRRRASTEVVCTEVVDRNSSSTDPTAEFIQRHDLLSQVLSLPPNQRAVIVLRYLEDLSVPEVAKIVGKREGAVRGICHRGLQNLRRPARNDPATQPVRPTATGSSYAV